MSAQASESRLIRPVDGRRDHIRGGDGRDRRLTILIYGDYLCPYCRRLWHVLERLRRALGDRMAYIFRHFPNERAHPGAGLMSIRSEAAARQSILGDARCDLRTRAAARRTFACREWDLRRRAAHSCVLPPPDVRHQPPSRLRARRACATIHGL